jgi:O-antigen/teichoic acid export membrane protein
MSSNPSNNTVAISSGQEIPQSPEVARAEKHTYGQILKSSALIGGSSMVNIAIGIVRTKVMAVLLGPSGFGLMGLYCSILDLAQAVAGLGINNSGVRQIAEAVGSGRNDRIAITVAVLRRTSVILGILGAALLLAFSKPVSIITFGSDHHTAAVALLSLAVFCRLVSAGQGALIQGMRRISDLAWITILGAFFGTIISIPVVYFMGEGGVAPAIISITASTLVASWWFSKKVMIPRVAMTIPQFRVELAPLMLLGFAFMVSGFLMMGSAFAVRTMVVRMIGLDAAGFYQAAWTLSGLYVGFILQSMGADFYPRLTAVAKDNTACNRTVNEQAHISLLLAGPGVIATLTFAPLVIALFYSTKFGTAVEVLRWICLGMTFQVITWPMGFILLSKGESRLFLLVDLAWTVVNIAFAWLCLKWFGLAGAGIAFFGSYVFHLLMLYPIVNWLSGFRWSVANIRTSLVFLPMIAVVLCGFYTLSSSLATVIGSLAVIISSIYSIRVLHDLVPLDRLPSSMQWLLLRFGRAR